MRLCNYDYVFIAPERLIPTEDINEYRALKLEQHIRTCGRWRMPVFVHKHVLFIMDGHHRLSVAKKLKLERLPVLLLDYDKVDVFPWRKGEIITPRLIIKMAQSGHRFPYKTTRHILKTPLPVCDIPLQELQ